MNKDEKKVFISHSSKDIEIANKLYDLLIASGIDRERMYCSTIPEAGTSLGESFVEDILDQFHNYDLFGILILSKNYYSSPSCLNEMGMFLLQDHYWMVVTPDTPNQTINGLIRKDVIRIEMGNGDSLFRFFELKNQLESFFETKLDSLKWCNRLMVLLRLYHPSLKSIRDVDTLSEILCHFVVNKKPISFKEITTLPHKKCVCETIAKYLQVLEELRLINHREDCRGGIRRVFYSINPSIKPFIT